MITLLTTNILNLTQATKQSDWGLDKENFQSEQEIILSGESSSSLDLAWHLIENNSLPIFGSVLVLKQNSGRGQLRRNWVSPVGNIYAAWHLPLNKIMKSKGAAVIVGALFCQAFNVLGFNVQLKWINDLVLNNKKIGGILLEERKGHLVAGIGINLNSFPDKEQLRKDHAITASSLGEDKKCFFSQIELLRLWSTLVNEAYIAYNNQIKTNNTDIFFNSAEKFLAFKNKKVIIFPHDTIKNKEIKGIITGLDNEGSLCLKDAQGQDFKIDYGSILPLE